MTGKKKAREGRNLGNSPRTCDFALLKIKVSSLYIKVKKVMCGPKMMCAWAPKRNEGGSFLPTRGLLL